MKKFFVGVLFGFLGFICSFLLAPVLLLILIYFITLMCFEWGYEHDYESSNDPNEDIEKWEI